MIKNQSHIYSFSCLDENNIKIRGMINAPNKAIAHYVLSSMGLRKISHIFRNFCPKKQAFSLNIKDKFNFILNIKILLQSGIPLIEILQTLKIESNQFKIKYLLFLALKNLREGHGFCSAFEKIFFNPFSDIEMNLLKAAELSGKLDTTLEFIQERIEKEMFIRQKLISASIYPCFTLTISIIVIFIIFYWVIPQFYNLFSQSKQNIPLMTQSIFYCADHFGRFFLICVLLIMTFVSMIFFLKKYHKISIAQQEKFMLSIPALGKLIKLNNRINFCYTMYSLLSAGITIDKAFYTSIQSINLPYSQQGLYSALKQLISGKNLSESLKKSTLLPASAIQTLQSAEHTGQVDNAFKALSTRYSQELSVFSDNLGKLIEPFIIIILGSIIGCVVIAIYLPMFQIGGLY